MLLGLPQLICAVWGFLDPYTCISTNTVKCPRNWLYDVMSWQGIPVILLMTGTGCIVTGIVVAFSRNDP
jgi:hypothetical protein